MTTRVITTLFGRDRYSFDAPAEHYRTRTNMSDEELVDHVQNIDTHFKEGNILYYFITDDLLDTEKGTRISSTVYHKAGKPKHRTVLNERARGTSTQTANKPIIYWNQGLPINPPLQEVEHD